MTLPDGRDAPAAAPEGNSDEPRSPSEDSLPAPVVTDEGVYGALPATMSPGEYERTRPRGGNPLAGLFAVVLTLAAAAWLLALSSAQATDERVAIPALERAVDALTGLGAHLAMHEEEVRRLADEAPAPAAPLVLPGVEVEGVQLTRREVTEGTPEEWHALLRGRIARVIYTDGVDALAPSGTAGAAGMFSASGGTRLFLETLSEDNHATASFALLPLGVVAAVALAGVLAFGGGFRRFRSAGFAIAVASLPAIGAGLLGLAVLATFGGSTPLTVEVREMASAIADVSLRNGLTALVAGAAIALPAIVLGAIFRPPREPGYEWDDEPAYVDADPRRR